MKLKYEITVGDEEIHADVKYNDEREPLTDEELAVAMAELESFRDILKEIYEETGEENEN